MLISQYTICISPHQVPLADALVNIVGPGEYRYVYRIPLTERRKNLGWSETEKPWMVPEYNNVSEARECLEQSKIVISGERDLDLFGKRLSSGLVTVYSAERWFKPTLGMLRLLSPSYLKMAWRFVKLLRQNPKMYYYPMGVHAASDMARLCGLFAGNLTCLFRTPKLDFERRPGGRIWLSDGVKAHGNKEVSYCLDKMRMWGYVVAPSTFTTKTPDQLGKCRLLWVGRFLNWKRLDTVIRAVMENQKINKSTGGELDVVLDIYGSGPEEKRLKAMAAGYEDAINFHPPVPNDYVRQLMREHDVYILSSNAYEGWGAVVSEAIAEGMKVIGTCEAGSSGTMLPKENLFHAGDWRGLLDVLKRGPATVDSDIWSAASFAKALVDDAIK